MIDLSTFPLQSTAAQLCIRHKGQILTDQVFSHETSAHNVLRGDKAQYKENYVP